jgi:hypothetical protein
MSDSHWTTVFSALLTPTIAVFVSIIAYQQWSTARNKLKLDLFDRRVAVYDAARVLITSIMTSGEISLEQEFKYLSGTRGARWLFGDNIVEYLDKELYSKVLDLWALQKGLEPLPIGEERTKNIQAQREIRSWQTAQLHVLDEKFAPYLSLRH